MKTPEEIRQIGKLVILTESDDGGNGFLMGMDLKKPNNVMPVVWSWGGGWDHVSVSWKNHNPTWDEMCAVKKMFFDPEEVCVEYHPAESEYVNHYPYCLHIWRYQQPGMPMPPAWMVGPKKGQTVEDSMREGLRELRKMEAGQWEK